MRCQFVQGGEHCKDKVFVPRCVFPESDAPVDGYYQVFEGVLGLGSDLVYGGPVFLIVVGVNHLRKGGVK